MIEPDPPISIGPLIVSVNTTFRAVPSELICDRGHECHVAPDLDAATRQIAVLLREGTTRANAQVSPAATTGKHGAPRCGVPTRRSRPNRRSP